MTVIEATTLIDAPMERCFRLSLNIDLELRAGAEYGLQVVGGVNGGVIGPGQYVTWKTRQFGFTVFHTTRITGFQEPVFFQDTMARGLFRSFSHDHFFENLDSKRTAMRDVLTFSFPKILAGAIAERLIVKRRLNALLSHRNALIKHYAETEILR